ncbi:MAG: hypothetical protein QF886_05355, partial [Planctomycetota bacterium]|nr:hypothetical protein [Planctomycetota bacterium]
MNDSDNSEQFSSDLDDASKRVAEESDQRKNEDSEIAPFSRQELQKAYVRPYLAIEYILGGRDRLAANLLRGHKLGMVAALLLLTSLFSPIPFGAVPPTNSCLKISILFTGSLFICLPCLHVFSQFLGISLSMTQNLSLALIVSSVAGLFSFGFFPIIWFIDYSTQAVSEAIFSTAGISVFL